MSDKIESPFCKCSKCVPPSLMMRALKAIGQTAIGVFIIVSFVGIFLGLCAGISWVWLKIPSLNTPNAALTVLGIVGVVIVVGLVSWGYDIGKNIWRDR